MIIITCPCGETLMTPVELSSGTCYLCTFSPPERTPEPVSDDVLLSVLRKGYIAGREAAFRDARANGSTWAASAGYSVESDLGADPDPPEPAKCSRCEETVTQYDVNANGQPLCFDCCEDLERWDFR